MKVTLERTFPMPARPDVTWGALTDIAGVAACMPGAAITEKVDDTHYKGTVKVKVGPATLSFRGDIEVRRLDAATRTLALAAKGTDTSGTSFASMDLTARVADAEGGTSQLDGHAEASVGGKAATFGGRMMEAVSDQILKQFAANFAARVAALEPPDADGTSASAGPGAPPGAVSETPLAPEARSPRVAPEAAAGSAAIPKAALSPPAAQPLNGLALIWAVLRDWWRGLFSRKSA